MEQVKYTVSEPTIEGEEATVPATIADRSVTFKLKNDNGVWKIYPQSDNPIDLIEPPMDEKDMEKALQNALPSSSSGASDTGGSPAQ